MQSRTVPSGDLILKQVISEVGIRNADQELSLKRHFDHKFNQHVNLIQYHRLREDRFIISQKKILEKQHLSIEKTKDYLNLKQLKAYTNKNYSIVEKSKRTEADLNRWERIVERNKAESERKIKLSEKLIHNWNQKLSQSSSRKSLKLNEYSQHLKVELEKRQKNALIKRSKYLQSHVKNPQEISTQQKDHQRYLSLSQKRQSRSSRRSTECIHDKLKKQEENVLEKLLMQTISKEERINEARYIKHYMLERKKKQQIEKEDAIKKMRQNHLNSIRNQIEERNEILDQKFKNSHTKARNKSSLPNIKGSKASNLIMSPGEQWRKLKRKHTNQTLDLDMPNKNYDRIIIQKLKDVSLIMRKNRRL